MRNARTRSGTAKWDPIEYLNSDRAILGYLNAALEEGDPALIAAVVGDIARARGMTEVARETGFGRESLYKALSREGNPQLSTVLKVLSALGIELRATAAPSRAPAKTRRARSL